VAAWSLDMFCNFYSVENQNITTNSKTSEAREKDNTYLESLDKNNQILIIGTDI
jgi:hypothetical protein